MACAVNAAWSGDVDMDINVEEISVVHFEEGTDIYIKTEEIPGDITFPKIKAEEDEVSYVCVCPLLDTSHYYRIMTNTSVISNLLSLSLSLSLWPNKTDLLWSVAH
jgi:hypothetical protein